MGSTRLRTVVSYIRRVSRPHGTDASDRELLQAFAAHGDETAFAALVERHAAMVFGVCRRVLAHHHSAEDATQAAFLVLARKAGAIRWRETVAPWLSSVAYRISLKAREMIFPSADSLNQECLSSAPPPDQAAGSSELRAIIDGEIQRLPDRLRDAVVLCYLEGKTYEQAARALGWRSSTVKGRLEKARGVLRSGLSGRDLLSGVGVSPVLFEALLASTFLPVKTAAAIAQTAVLIRAGEGTAPALLSPTVAALMACPLPGVTLTKIGLLAAVFLAVGAGIVGGAFLAGREAAKEIQQPIATGQQTKVDQSALNKPAANAQARLDRFGDLLPPDAIGRFGTTRLRHGGRIGYLRFTPDGKMLVSAGADGVRIWNAATAALRWFIPKPREALAGATIDLSPDGKWLAIPDKAHITIKSAEDCREVRYLEAEAPTRVCFSPDGVILASVSGRDGTEIKLWDSASGRLLRSWKESQGPITSLLFVGNSKTLITGNTAWRPPGGRDQNHISSWDTSTGKEKGRIELLGFGPSQISASADGKLLAALCRTNMESHVQVWDLATGNEIWRLEPNPTPKDQPGRPMELNSLTFFPDGRLLVAGRGDDELVIWSLTGGIEKRKFDRDIALSGVLAVSPDGLTVTAAAGGMAIRLIDWASGKDRFPEISSSYHEVVGFAANDRTVLMRGRHHVTVWEPADGRDRKLFERVDRTFFRMRLIAEGRQIQVWEEFPRRVDVRAVSTWDVATGRQLQRIECPQKTEEWIYPLALSPDGKTVALLDMKVKQGLPENVTLMDMATGKVRATLTGNQPMGGRACFTPDGLKLVVWCPGSPSSLNVWDMLLNQRLWQIRYQGPGPMDGFDPVISPDGRKVVVAGLNRALLIYDLGTGELAQLIEKLADMPHVVEFSKHGRSLAWAGKESPTISIIDLATGRERRRLSGHEGRVTSLQFSADGKMLVSYSDDMTALAWDLLVKPAPAER